MRLVVCALMLAGCRAGTDRSPPPTSDTTTMVAPDTAATGVKACELLSSDDVKEVTGVTFEAGVTTNDYAGDTQCRFDRRGEADSGLMVTLHAHGNLVPYQNVPGSSEVGGLGDAAVWHGGNRQLAVRYGDAVFSISFLAPPAEKQWAVQLARSALTKLSAGGS